jgi:Nif-specific regulatory protein
MKASLKNLQFQTLKEISGIIDKALDLEETLGEILEILSRKLSMKRGTITLFDSDTGNLSISASCGLSSEEKKRGVYQLGEGVTGRIFKTGQPFIVPDISKEPLFLNKTGSRKIKKEGLSFIGVPVILNAEPIGVLNADRLFENEISFIEDLEFLCVVATLIAQFISINRKVEKREEVLKKENVSLRSQISKKTKGLYMVGRSSAMAEVQRKIEKVAPTKASVLLLGESGVGKTLIAKLIHILSDRKNYPFIKVNCASIPENLLESELFGAEKGAFTGATHTRQGRFEEGEKGTIFLDEIGELSFSIQAKLLRIIQEREFERLGSSKTRKIDVRIITATNQDLETLCTKGKFREDLYYRLNVFPVTVPALRKRKDDIPGLLNHFASKISEEYNKNISFTPESLDFLINYSWPGNVREMENLMERLAIMSEDRKIDISFLKEYISPSGNNLPDEDHKSFKSNTLQPDTVLSNKDSSLHTMEKERIINALEKNSWLQYKAAEELGITPRQIGYRIKKYNLDPVIAHGKVRIRNN